jgi:ABC-type uncharacterized transport system involved in gliding motility auxiliary subunit
MAVRVPRRTLAIAAAALGLVGLVVAVLLFAVQQQAGTAVYIGLVVAVVGFIGALALGRESLARAAQGRQARYGLNALLAVGAVAGILIVINFVVYQNPKSWDLTENSQYSLAPETIAAVKSLGKDVELIGFYSQDRSSTRDSLRPLLKKYQELSGGHVSYRFVDPREQPLLASQYGVTRDASLVAVMGSESEVVASATEQEITGALIRLANPGSRKVYFLTGHGERDIQDTGNQGYSDVRQALEAKNYKVESLSLLVTPQVPQGALAVVVAGPTAPLRDSEVEALKAYLEKGGGLVVLSDPLPGAQDAAAGDPLADYLTATWGLTLQHDLNIDPNSFLGPAVPIADSYAQHPVTDKLQSLASYFPTSRSLTVADTSGGVTRTPLILTGSTTWGETNLASATSVKFDSAEDIAGPLVVAAAADDSTRGARVIAVGDSDFGADASFFDLGNGDLLVNSVDWAAHQDALISLTPKASTPRVVTPPSRETLFLVFVASVILVPVAFVVLGVSTWWGRRSKA